MKLTREWYLMHVSLVLRAPGQHARVTDDHPITHKHRRTTLRQTWDFQRQEVIVGPQNNLRCNPVKRENSAWYPRAASRVPCHIGRCLSPLEFPPNAKEQRTCKRNSQDKVPGKTEVIATPSSGNDQTWRSVGARWASKERVVLSAAPSATALLSESGMA